MQHELPQFEDCSAALMSGTPLPQEVASLAASTCMLVLLQELCLDLQCMYVPSGSEAHDGWPVQVQSDVILLMSTPEVLYDETVSVSAQFR